MYLTLHPGNFASYILHLNDVHFLNIFYTTGYLLFPFILFVCVFEHVCDMGISSEITILPARAVL